jgi:tetratricopeptide (TPR) repeat protein
MMEWTLSQSPRVDELPQLQIALADRYTIDSELGRGGMGVVYRAWDLKHARPVALKVVRPEFGSVLAAERFLREIQLAAQLQHPHIVPLYDSGDAGGALFYVMPLVEGESLRARLGRERQLPLDEALQITREVADALSYAHSHDVVHRDIKPENILLAGGHAVVVDFGIGRAITAAGGDRLTESGISVGTPAYMSPEQASADTQVDGRSDDYSLACVLYEMLAGHPPFLGATAQEVIVRHTLDPVPSLRSARPGVPRAVERAITKGLAKVPADRFTTAAAFAVALDDAMTAPAEAEAPTTGPQGIRRRWSWIGTGALVVVAGTVLALGLRPATVYVPGRVVVVPLENQTGDSALNGFARQFGATLPDAIAREGVGEPVPAATARDLLARATGQLGQVAEWLARETRAGIELRGACSRAAPGTTCQVDVLRMPAKVLRMSVRVTGDPAQPGFAAELTERVLVALLLQQTYGDRVTWLGEYVSPSLVAVRAFVRAEEMGIGGDRYREAARLDTAWVEAAARAAWGERAYLGDTTQLQRLATRPGLLPGDRETVALILNYLSGGSSEQGFELAQRRAVVNPERWSGAITVSAVATGRANTAVAVSGYADSAVHMPGGELLKVYAWRGYALHELGRYHEELQLARDLAQRFAGGAQLEARTLEAMALAALGEVDSLQRRLAEWAAIPEDMQDWAGTRALIAGEELMAHGREREGRRVLETTLPFYRRVREREGYTSAPEIDVLEATNRLEEARRLALAALPRMRSRDDSLEFLAALGRIAARQGERSEALRYDQLLATTQGGSPLARAAIASHLGDWEGAVRLLEEARAGGSGYWVASSWNIHRDPNFAPLRTYPPFQRFLKPRG